MQEKNAEKGVLERGKVTLKEERFWLQQAKKVIEERSDAPNEKKRMERLLL